MEKLSNEEFKTLVYAIPVKTKIKNINIIPEDVKIKILEQMPLSIRKHVSITILNQYLDLGFLRSNAFSVDKFEHEAMTHTKNVAIGQESYINYMPRTTYHKTIFKLIVFVIKMKECKMVNLSGMSLLQSFSKNEFNYVHNVTSVSNGIRCITNLDLVDTFNKEFQPLAKDLRYNIDASLYIDINSTDIKNARFVFKNTELKFPNVNSKIRMLRLDELDYDILNGDKSRIIRFMLHDASSMKKIIYN
jgi:hypothetical protein